MHFFVGAASFWISRPFLDYFCHNWPAFLPTTLYTVYRHIFHQKVQIEAGAAGNKPHQIIILRRRQRAGGHGFCEHGARTDLQQRRGHVSILIRTEGQKQLGTQEVTIEKSQSKKHPINLLGGALRNLNSFAHSFTMACVNDQCRKCGVGTSDLKFGCGCKIHVVRAHLVPASKCRIQFYCTICDSYHVATGGEKCRSASDQLDSLF